MTSVLWMMLLELEFEDADEVELSELDEDDDVEEVNKLLEEETEEEDVVAC
jgi:hypothetical protein